LCSAGSQKYRNEQSRHSLAVFSKEKYKFGEHAHVTAWRVLVGSNAFSEAFKQSTTDTQP
jgi:hypothetical protein